MLADNYATSGWFPFDVDGRQNVVVYGTDKSASGDNYTSNLHPVIVDTEYKLDLPSQGGIIAANGLVREPR